VKPVKERLVVPARILRKSANLLALLGEEVFLCPEVA
jgi:hypothetical protein